MKKFLTMFLAAMLLSGALVVGKAQAFPFQLGFNDFLMRGYSKLHLDDAKLWGLFRVSEITRVGEILPYWAAVPGGPHFLTIKFGGLDVAVPAPTGGGPVYFSGGWAELWHATGVDPFPADVATGPGLDYHPGNFGLETADGTMLLDLAFAPVFPAPVGAPAGTPAYLTFRGLVDAVGGVDTEGYLDVVGGSFAGFFDTNRFLFPLGAVPASLLLGANDLYISGDNVPTALYGWTHRATDYSTHAYVVPEPGTILLLGLGLLGLAAFAWMRRRNQV